LIVSTLDNSEIEQVVQENGKTDFVGGIIHGWEKTNSITVTANPFTGSSFTVDETIDSQSDVLESVVIEQVSTFYEHMSVPLVPWFTCTKTWTFDSTGAVNITQRFVALRTAIIDTFYLCLFKPVSAIPNTGHRSNDLFLSKDLTGDPTPPYLLTDADARSANLWYTYGDDGAGLDIEYKMEVVSPWSQQDVLNTTYSGANDTAFWAGTAGNKKQYNRIGYTQISTNADIQYRFRYRVLPV
jgi:hypothetical protein